MWFVANPFGEFIVGEESAHALSEPVSLDVARKDLSIPLPDGATGILYAQYAHWIAHEFMLKFEAPLEVCKSHALVLLERHNTDMPQNQVAVELRNLTEPPNPVPSGPPLNVTWFDIHNIKNGFVGGEVGPSQPRIWIDADRGILYYSSAD